ncbi:MAG: hypothetical protein ACLFSR_06330, partial [Halomonas sp.]
MADGLTKSAARNIFYGGSLFFFLLFTALTAHSHWYMVNTSTDKEGLTESVVEGKHIWEKNMCINCHSIMGEGAYFALAAASRALRWRPSPGAPRGIGSACASAWASTRRPST